MVSEAEFGDERARTRLSELLAIDSADFDCETTTQSVQVR
jgi:hypothetical protein